MTNTVEHMAGKLHRVRSVGLDLGSTTTKETEAETYQSIFSVFRRDYRSYLQSHISVQNGSTQEVRAWWGDVLAANIEKLLVLAGSNYDALGVTGLSNSGLSVVEKKSGKPLVMFYDKPPLVYSNDDQASVILKKAGIDSHADITYTWSKALAYRQKFAQIREYIGRGTLRFEETGIEPMVCTIARLLTNTPFSEGPGFYSHEYKGITGSPNGVTSNDVRRVLAAMEYSPDQFTVSDGNQFLEDTLFMAGDFQTLLSYARTMQEAGKLVTDVIGIETGSNMKVWMKADGKSTAMPRYSDMGFAYRLLRNGAAVHTRIFMKYLLPDGTDQNEWFIRACKFAESAKDSLLHVENVQYMYFPKVADEESIGVLWDRRKGEEVKWDDVLEMSSEVKAQVAAAVYAGVAAELRKILEEIRGEKGVKVVYLHDQFVSEENQSFKPELLASMFGPGFDTYLAGIPNASEMIALSAARMKSGDKVVSSHEIDKTFLVPIMDLEEYFREWSNVRRNAYNTNLQK